LKRFSYRVIAVFTAVSIAGAAQAWSLGGPAAASGADDDAADASPLCATGDFNHDGIADLIEVQRTTNDTSGGAILSVLLGQADGTFKAAESQYPIGRDPRALVVGDFNGDGNPDVIVGDSDGTLREFLGDGRGTLVDEGIVAQVGSVVSIAAGHFTHNGELDIAVSDLGANSAIIFLGAGDGSLRRVWSFQLPQKGDEFHLVTADFNGDGISDLVITKEDDDQYEVMLGNGNGTFTYAPKLSFLKDPASYCPT